VSAGWQTKSYEFDRTPSGKVEAEGMNYTCLTAINEIVDNSIQWTKPNDGARVISVDLSKEVGCSKIWPLLIQHDYIYHFIPILDAKSS
jgi:hypothetical protein